MSESRTPFIAGNWKMNDAGAVGFIDSLVAALSAQSWDSAAKEVWVCPPFTLLSESSARAQGSGIEIAAQNMHQAASGAFTGEISAQMLATAGARGVILGHSERREYFAETDQALSEKLVSALEAQLVPILCVGETDAEREAGETESKLRRQVDADLAKVDVGRLSEVVIAYEPIWAIGTGKTATPEQAQETVAFIRSLVRGGDQAAAESIRILYGGSVKASNAQDLLSQPDIDGALVGGASLDPAEFAEIVAGAG